MVGSSASSVWSLYTLKKDLSPASLEVCWLLSGNNLPWLLIDQILEYRLHGINSHCFLNSILGPGFQIYNQNPPKAILSVYQFNTGKNWTWMYSTSTQRSSKLCHYGSHPNPNTINTRKEEKSPLVLPPA